MDSWMDSVMDGCVELDFTRSVSRFLMLKVDTLSVSLSLAWTREVC